MHVLLSRCDTQYVGFVLIESPELSMLGRKLRTSRAKIYLHNCLPISCIEPKKIHECMYLQLYMN